jgi:hypothetical protein
MHEIGGNGPLNMQKCNCRIIEFVVPLSLITFAAGVGAISDVD